VEDLLHGLRTRQRWRAVREDDVRAIIEQSDKQRFQMDGGRIRALYGHSISQHIARQPADPPAWLFHGTSARAVGPIRREGLRSMRRQSVHLSTDEETARAVARRRPGPWVILRIDAQAAREAGVRFYRGAEQVWLADAIPPSFIHIPPS
jgi:putative RNA 2'-phosphotransferase